MVINSTSRLCAHTSSITTTMQTFWFKFMIKKKRNYFLRNFLETFFFLIGPELPFALKMFLKNDFIQFFKKKHDRPKQLFSKAT